MKKSEIANQYEYKCSSMFIAAAVALAANSVLSLISSAVDNMPSGIAVLVQIFAIVFTLFAYVITIYGFSVLDKACRLSEENECYYMGKKLKIMAVASIVLTIISGIAAFLFGFILNSYKNAADLSAADKTAAANIQVITAIILIIYQLVAISTPYILYLWKIHKYTPKTDSINNFALLTMIVFIVQLVIGIMNSVYALNGSSSFLAGFSSVLLVVKYLLLMLLFISKRNNLSDAMASESEENQSLRKNDENN